MRGTPKGFEWLRGNGHSLPPPRGPIPLIKGKCPEGTKGIGKVPPQGADEGGYRWCGGPRTGGWGHPPLRRVTIDFVGAAVPSGPSITGAPRGPPHPSWPTAMPPSPLRGEGFGRSVGNAQMSMALPSSVMAAPCHLPPGEGFFDSLLCFSFTSSADRRWPHSRLFRCRS